MKTTLELLAVIGLVLLGGCASQEAYDNYANSQMWIAEEYYDAAKKPLLDLKLPAPEGKEYHLVVNREVEPIHIQQIKDSEWVGTANTAISVAGMVGNLAVGMNGAGTHTENVGGDYVKGYQANPVTTTTNTEIAPIQ